MEDFPFFFIVTSFIIIFYYFYFIYSFYRFSIIWKMYQNFSIVVLIFDVKSLKIVKNIEFLN